MRHRFAFLFLFVTFTISAQDEPLSAVTARTTPLIVDTAPAVVLAVEPSHELHTPTLIEAARANDYLTFDALYREARSRGESLPQFTPLHELWSHAISDPIGAFYGRALYERLSRAYPGYAAFIEEYRLVDNNGDEWWPTSETRKFLVDRAVEGLAPRVLVADIAPAIDTASAAPAIESAVVPEQSRRVETAPGPKNVKPAVETVVTAASAAAISEPTAREVATPAAEEVVAPQIAVTPAAVATPAPSTAPSTVVPASIPPVPAAPPAADAPRDSRALLLLVVGIIGVGLLAVMFRTPSEAVEVVEKTAAPVEPIRRPEAPAQAERPTSSRATGSHG